LAWLSGRALVINIVTLRRARLIIGWVTVCGYWVNHLGMTSHLGQLSLPFHPSINEYRQHADGKGVRITSVGWQVTLCDPVWQVVSRAH